MERKRSSKLRSFIQGKDFIRQGHKIVVRGRIEILSIMPYKKCASHFKKEYFEKNDKNWLFLNHCLSSLV